MWPPQSPSPSLCGLLLLCHLCVSLIRMLVLGFRAPWIIRDDLSSVSFSNIVRSADTLCPNKVASQGLGTRTWTHLLQRTLFRLPHLCVTPHTAQELRGGPGLSGGWFAFPAWSTVAAEPCPPEAVCTLCRQPRKSVTAGRVCGDGQSPGARASRLTGRPDWQQNLPEHSDPIKSLFLLVWLPQQSPEGAGSTWASGCQSKAESK